MKFLGWLGVGELGDMFDLMLGSLARELLGIICVLRCSYESD